MKVRRMRVTDPKGTPIWVRFGESYRQYEMASHAYSSYQGFGCLISPPGTVDPLWVPSQDAVLVEIESGFTPEQRRVIAALYWSAGVAKLAGLGSAADHIVSMAKRLERAVS